jgi:lipid II:glycine glycyltransferase (peptidoglycan interpeptide bridge formation enzyme)
MTTASVLTVDTLPGREGCVLRQAERREWIDLAAAFDDHNYRHCWDYAAMLAARANAIAENVVALRDGEATGLASVRVKLLPGMRTGIAYIAGGPLVRRCDDGSPRPRLELVLAALKEEYVDRRHLVLRVAPAIGDDQWNLVQDECLLAAGFRAAAHLPPYRTMVVDIGRPLAEVRSGLAKKWRYHLSSAERQAMLVTEGHDPEHFDDFIPLFDELVARKELDVDLGADFYARLQPQLPESERLHVAIAWVEGRPAAGVVASMHGDTAVYLLGASNDLGRTTNAAYLLQWRVIEAAVRRGCTWYDLGGIDPEGNPGVYRFKQRMGGAERSSPGPYEFEPSRLSGTMVRAAERTFRAAAARRPRRR